MLHGDRHDHHNRSRLQLSTDLTNIISSKNELTNINSSKMNITNIISLNTDLKNINLSDNRCAQVRDGCVDKNYTLNNMQLDLMINKIHC